ncbi:AsmA family protein [Vibrio rumoiensis]|uniref:Cell envelope biogenesis protein AsmA n=1 Tax=Vibrio rumoiensis 1S-45 TaxID=1188252 RepID=A0A1E5E3M2_9VIBR|nr:AsmA family protein [Vibrio rumoiensis]OEF26941.1 cell envelope biogenesis protein AsmA [Vibrio rumoiensis 1S-45]
MKKILIFISIPIVAILIAILALVVFVNPNQFKPLIVEQTKEQTGFDLVIDGDISWSFFPHIGFNIGKTQVLNPNGFKQAQVVKIDEVALDISVLPLLEKKLDIGNVTLNGADIFIHTLKDGRSNLDIMKQSVEGNADDSGNKEAETVAQKDPESTTVSGATDELAAPWQVSLAGIAVNNAKLEMIDDKNGSQLSLSDVNFALSQFQFDQWSKAEFNIKGKNNQQTFSAAGETEFKVSQDLKDYELRSTQLEAKFKDPSTDIEKLTVNLDSFKFDNANSMKVGVKGKAADMNIDINQAASLTVNKAMTFVRLDDMTVKGKVDGKALPLSPVNIDMASNVSFDLTKQYLDVTLKKLGINDLLIDGNAQVSLAPSIPKIVFDLHSPEINVDALLKQMNKGQTAADPKTASTANKAPAKSTSNVSQSEPDLSATRTLDVTGKVAIDKLTANNAKMQNVVTQFKVNRGVIDLQRLAANLYGGSVNANARIDARKNTPTYSIHKEVKGVQVQPLLKDVANMDFVSGTGNITADLTGQSFITDKVKQNLAGVIKLNFADGSFYGVNVAHEIRTVQALFNGKKAEADTVKKTDFSALTSTMNLSKGVMKTDNLAMQSPLLRILGKGQANYVNETVDFLVTTSIVGTLKGQGGKDTNELKDITLPISIKGTWAEPKIRPDLNAALDDQTKQKAKEKIDEAKVKAQKEVDRGIDKLLGGKDSDKNDDVKKAAGDLLNNLFK